ncbi:MAG: glutamate--tRNA ligase [Candidatus Doudnabacteria bacterium]|nr:glutamate--tRNA ligase [Candidatus Doudnabacteria bacterium]
MPQEVRTRFAPSPTGSLHIGSLRTALFSFLWAKKNNGKFILRVEDTDKAREVAGSLEEIVKGLSEFGLSPDEGFVWENNTLKERGDYGPYLQSQRLDLYKKYSQELIEKKAAYYCFCTAERLAELRSQQQAQKLPPKYDKFCLKLSEAEIKEKLNSNTPHVIRLNVPAGQKIRFTDLVHGEIEIPSNDVDDQVLIKSDGYPTYHLGVVVDDHLMNITHVIRGEEWIPSTPKHILLYSAFGWELPVHAHAPNILGKSGKKLSKREGEVSVKSFLDKGYLPEALVNYVAFLGWNPKSEKEIFSLDELIKEFDIKNINKAGAVFDTDKLDWVNGMYIRKMNPEELLQRINLYPDHDLKKYPKEFLLKIVKLEQERLKKLSEIGERVKYFFEEPQYDPDLLVWKKSDRGVIKQNLEILLEFLKANDPSEEKIKHFIEDNNLKTGELLWPLRVALTGMDASPGPFEIMDAFMSLPNGKEIILGRVEKAIKLL